MGGCPAPPRCLRNGRITAPSNSGSEGWGFESLRARTRDRDVRELLSPTETVLEHVGAIPWRAYRDPAADGPPDGAGAAFAHAALGR